MTGGAGRPAARALRRAVVLHRRLLAAGLAAGAVACGILAVAPPRPATVAAVVTTADLDGGTTLAAADLTTANLPPAAVPDGALRSLDDAVGRVMAGPARTGEPLTDVRLVGASLLAGYGGGSVGVPVRVADQGTVGLLRPGDVVDVLAADPGVSSDDPAAGAAAPARTVAAGARVVTVPRGGEGDGFLGAGGVPSADGALVVLATTPSVAAELAGAAATARLSLTLRAG